MVKTLNQSDLVAAVEAMLPLIEEERRGLVEHNSKLAVVHGKIRPVPGTLEPDVVEIVTEYDRAITLAYKSLGVEE